MNNKIELSYENISNELLDFINLLNSTHQIKSYFSEYLNKFSRIRERLDLNKIEVGIIGITSSGKSTMLNSILGEKLLPEKVKPSSGIQVICEYGNELKAIIFFKSINKKPEIVIKNISSIIEEYGDETENPNNQKEVDEIRLYSPKFRLNKNVVLVDTPGLDAFGLESHEKITLQLVLPTIQMIMFLTTVKASSDNKNLELIDQVTTENKPLIVVQNMIDSICHKESKQGILKTVEEVQKEHFHRVKKLLHRAEKKSVKEAPVIQISALKAKSDWDSSGMNSLDEILTKLIKQTEPQRLYIFLRQIKNYLNEIKNDLDMNNNKVKSYEDNINLIKKIDEDITLFQANFIREISSFKIQVYDVISIYDILSKKILDSYQGKNPEVKDFYLQKDIDKLINKMSLINENFSSFINEIQTKIELFCEKQNLQSYDIVKKQRLIYFNTEINNKPIQDKKDGKKKDGVWNWIKGIFGKAEYDQISVDLVDIKSLLQNLHQKIQEWSSFIELNIKTFLDNIDYSLNILKKDINSKKINEENKVGLTLDKKISLEIIRFIDSFFIKFNINILNITDLELKNEFKPFNILKNQNIPSISLDIFKLVHNNSFKRLYDLRNKIIEKSTSKNIIICGWDSIHINRFMDYFFSDLKDSNIEEGFFKKDLDIENSIFSSVTIINDSQKNDQFKFSSDSLIFLIVNTIQKGSTLKKIKNSKIMKNNTNKIVWVMDSIIEFKKNDHLLEGFNEFINIIEESEKNILEVMVSDKDLFYSVLLHELFFNKKKLESKSYQQQFIKDVKKYFNLSNEETNKIGNYINQWGDICLKM